jgi:hypothetical protein
MSSADVPRGASAELPLRLDSARRRALDEVIRAGLDELDVPFERVDAGTFLVTLAGEHKLATMTWLVLQDYSLLVEAFFMRKPAENVAGTYGFLLGRNARSYGVHFAIDRLGDVYLTGRLPLAAVSPSELDRVLGCVRTYADENFDPALKLGFAGAIRREQAWRARLAAQTGPGGAGAVSPRPAGLSAGPAQGGGPAGGGG